MSVLEIEKEVFKLPLQQKQSLSSWLIELLEDEEDAEAVRAAREEGGKPIPWEQIKKEIHWDDISGLKLNVNFVNFLRLSKNKLVMLLSN